MSQLDHSSESSSRHVANAWVLLGSSLAKSVDLLLFFMIAIAICETASTIRAEKSRRY